MKRDLRLDSLKGVLIILVILGHVPYSYFHLEKIYLISRFNEWLYFFHMPLFLAISILFIKKEYFWVAKRALLVLLPYLFWFLYAHYPMLVHQKIEFTKMLLIGNWDSLKSILWFLPTLFSLNILFFLSLKTKKLRNLLLILSITSFIFVNTIVKYHNTIPFGIDIAVYLFILAYAIKYIYTNQENIISINLYILILIITISSLFLFYFEPLKTHSPWHHIIDLAQFSVASTFIGYISFMLLNISIFILFLKINANKTLALIGFYSLPIFLLHLMILYKVPKIISFDSFGVNILFLLGTLGTTIFLPIVISRSLMKISKKFKYIGMS